MVLTVEFLYYAPCPFNDHAVALLEATLAKYNCQATIHRIEITTREQAEAVHFLGSPTIRVNGHDIEHRPDGVVALGCRIYATIEGPKGYPCVTMIEKAIEHALGLTG